MRRRESDIEGVGKHNMNLKLWGVLVILLLGLGGISYLLSNQQNQPQTERFKPPTETQGKAKPETRAKLRNATKQPGRVVVLNTNRGTIEFVLYEKDCPKTTARIAGLVQSGAYNGVKFPRVEDWVIQTDEAKKRVAPMGIEVVNGLTHAKGSVGMARPSDPNMNTSVFYITLDPSPHLDLLYTNFGRVFKGMDVAIKIHKGDVIKKATLRAFTDADKKLFYEALKIEAERRTQ